jgi:hypothetical protein
VYEKVVKKNSICTACRQAPKASKCDHKTPYSPCRTHADLVRSGCQGSKNRLEKNLLAERVKERKQEKESKERAFEDRLAALGRKKVVSGEEILTERARAREAKRDREEERAKMRMEVMGDERTRGRRDRTKTELQRDMDRKARERGAKRRRSGRERREKGEGEDTGGEDQDEFGDGGEGA